VPGYGNDLDLQDYADAIGFTIPAGAILTAARARGSAYIDGLYGRRFTGSPTGGLAQEREWPRTGATDRYGASIAPDAIPDRVVWASYEAALYELGTPGGLSPVTTPGQRVKRRKVGPLEREFFESSGDTDDDIPRLASVEGLLAPLLTVEYLAAVVVV
jgi:hypothetical protein